MGGRTKSRLFCFTLMFVCFFITREGISTNELDEIHQRPKIGLVLSGGGARGGAHLGVLKVLEELRIPIDFIAGTSMGAIVGGFYASGLSPQQIEALMLEIDWRDVFYDRPPRQDLSFRRKSEDGRYLAAFEFGLKNGKLVAPRGLVIGHKMNFLFQKLTFHCVAIEDFDQLPIPFRALATNLETGRMMVFKSGNLGNALRSSMSVPGAIAPVEIEGNLLIGGGLVNNLPVDIVREMGADIIIAINVASPLQTRDSLNSALAISSQMVTMLMEQNNADQQALIGEGDFLLEPELTDIRATDFVKTFQAMQLGEEAARKRTDALCRFSVSDEEYNQFLKNHRRKINHDVTVDYINVSHHMRTNPQMVFARMKTKVGDRLDFSILEDDLNTIYQMGHFESVNLEIIETEGTYGLLIDAREKPWGPGYMRFGFLLSNDFKGEKRYAILGNYILTNINSLGAEWESEFTVGLEQSFRTEFYQPLDLSGNWFVDPNLKYGEVNMNASGDSSNLWYSYHLRFFEAGLELGRQFGNLGQVTAGMKHMEADVSSGSGYEGSIGNIRNGGFYVNFIFDQINSPYFPTSGGWGTVTYYQSMEEFGAAEIYRKLSTNFGHAFTIKKNTFLLTGEFGSGLGDEPPFYDRFHLGGHFNLSGLKHDQLSGTYLVLARFFYFRETSLTILGSSIFMGTSFECGNVWEQRSDALIDDLIFSRSYFIGAQTMFGGFYFAYASTDRGDSSFYLLIGNIF